MNDFTQTPDAGMDQASGAGGVLEIALMLQRTVDVMNARLGELALRIEALEVRSTDKAPDLRRTSVLQPPEEATYVVVSEDVATGARQVASGPWKAQLRALQHPARTGLCVVRMPEGKVVAVVEGREWKLVKEPKGADHDKDA